MPRVGRFGRPRKRAGNKPSVEEPSSPLIDSPPPTQDPLTIDASSSSLPPSTWLDATSSAEALLQAPPATHSWLRLRQFLDAFSEVPPSSVGVGAPSSSQFPPPSTDARTLNQITSTLNDITTSMEAPSYAPPAIQTRPRSRQYRESPSQAPRHSTNAPPSTQASPPTDGTPSMETPSQVQQTIRTRLQRRQHMETPSQTQPPSTDAPPSIQAPPPSTDDPPSIQAPPPSTNATQPIQDPLDAPSSPQVPPPSFHAQPFTPTSSTSVDDTSSPESPSRAPPATGIHPRRRECKKKWTVDVIDASGATKVLHLKLKDLWKLRDGTKVVVPLDDSNQPVGEAGSLLAMAIARLGADFTALPICYKSWLKVPKHYKEEVYNSKIKEKFIINSNMAKKMVIGRIGDKWRANRNRTFRRYYDPKLSREQNYLHHPLNITRAQWIWFIDYRLDPNTDQMCKRNAEIRGRSAIVPRGEPKPLSRKQFEMEEDESEEPVGRGKVSVATHANVDGSFATEATKSSREKRIRSENGGSCPQAIPLDDSLGQVMGKESLGRVRGLGSGPCPTPAFRTKEDCCLNSDVLAKMQQEIADLRAQLEKETRSRIEFQKDVSLILQNVATPVMTPELAALLTPLLTRALQAASANARNGF
ncbi:hypothetical protein PIB30_005466 [Stylosanthes scabra]|uniref:Uncharacterized protein n=1 Tax=Stylosanthes scabra TaxID=79078 RepID=A0ABU6Y5R8_9FABA|nr:hypothetical protein [Stylosanthes scabra]